MDTYRRAARRMAGDTPSRDPSGSSPGAAGSSHSFNAQKLKLRVSNPISKINGTMCRTVVNPTCFIRKYMH